MPDATAEEEAFEPVESASDKLRNRISKFLPDELRKKLEDHGLPTTGTNDELVDRLVTVLSKSEDIHQIIPESKQNRIEGYCIHWQGNDGIVINEDTGEEYKVNREEVMSTDAPLLHTFEAVEFSVDGDRATRVTKPGGKKVQYLWRKSARRGRDPPVGEKRYLGYIERFGDNHGFIVFKEANFRDMYFPSQELQTTGVNVVPLGAEVEFHIGLKGKKQAQRITRAGGGLITVEQGILGKFLRNNNTPHEEKQEIEVEEESDGIVMSGIVGDWFPRTETGIIWPMNGCKTVHCKVDEIISTGLKLLRPNTEVEFTAVKENGQVVAKNVTGPGGTPYIDAPPGPVHDYLDKMGKTFEEQNVMDIDPVAKFTGKVKMLTNNDEFGYIQPTIPGAYRHVEFTYHQINWVGCGLPRIPVNTEVEFSTCAWDDGTVRAIKISRIGGEPFEISPEELAERERLLSQRHSMTPIPQQKKEKKEIEADIQVEVKNEKESTDGEETNGESRKRKADAEEPQTKRKRISKFDQPVPARPRPDHKRALLGIIVDFNLPSMKGILQPYQGHDGGDCKDLLPFDISALQCDGFRGVEKWSTVEFTLVPGEKDDDISTAEYITSIENRLIQFDEENLLQRERLMIEAHGVRFALKKARQIEEQLRQAAQQYNSPHIMRSGHPPRPQNGMGWRGKHMPYPPGMPHFPPPMMQRGRGFHRGWGPRNNYRGYGRRARYGRGRGRGRRGRRGRW